MIRTQTQQGERMRAKGTHLDAIVDLFGSIGVEFGKSTKMLTRDDAEYESLGRRKVTFVAFGTTAFVFGAKGNYLGRTYMSRDECDYFHPRTFPDRTKE